MIEEWGKSDFIVFVNLDETIEEGEQAFSSSVDGPEDVSWLLSDDEVTMQIELA